MRKKENKGDSHSYIFSRSQLYWYCSFIIHSISTYTYKRQSTFAVRSIFLPHYCMYSCNEVVDDYFPWTLDLGLKSLKLAFVKPLSYSLLSPSNQGSISPTKLLLRLIIIRLIKILLLSLFRLYN
jgi:hypothetical protein